MTVCNRELVLLGGSAVVSHVHIAPKPDGSFVVVACGGTSDSGGNVVRLDDVSSTFPAETAALQGAVSLMLSELRKANGLES